ncbi:MAG: hypothetical protein HGA39_09615 [Coriobacteriia bacterium]|nr:hypothetical protein [Coriobacteriia bacterium]
MDTIDRTVLMSLASRSEWPSVSVYLPTHRAGAEKEQDRLRLKNLLKSACDTLVADGMSERDADALLAPAHAVLTDETFWLTVSESLAFFISPDGSPVYQVDARMPEQIVVGDRFYLRPLALAYRGDDRFYALAFDRNRARLFLGDRTSISEIPLKEAPTSLAEENQYDVYEKSLQSTTHSSPQSTAHAGPAIAMFHGHGGDNADKGELGRYASDLERAVTREIGAEHNVPLVLLGVEYELAAYRSANTYPALVAEQALGAVGELTDRQIHAKALETLSPRFHHEVEADLTELGEKSGALVSSDPVEIVSAAATGRVKTLFFDQAAGPYGHFDRRLYVVRALCSAAPRYLRDSADTELPGHDCGWDLVDLALAETVLHGGAIHAFAGEDAPIAGVAAILRY